MFMYVFSIPAATVSLLSSVRSISRFPIKSSRPITKLLMLSATPVNNKMNDIKNQIAFITEDKDNALEEIGISSINHTLKNAQAIFNQWSKLDDNTRTGEKFVDMMDLDYFKLLDTLTIARSRKHIEKYYDLDTICYYPENAFVCKCFLLL